MHLLLFWTSQQKPHQFYKEALLGSVQTSIRFFVNVRYRYKQPHLNKELDCSVQMLLSELNITIVQLKLVFLFTFINLQIYLLHQPLYLSLLPSVLDI